MRQDLPPWLRPDEDGRRRCTFADGFQASERPYGLDPPVAGGVIVPIELRVATEEGPEASLPEPTPPLVDCTQPCASPSFDETWEVHKASVRDRAFLPSERRGLDLFRTPAACAAATDTPPTALPADLCTTLGSRLR
jgi:hypothetical protein